MTPPLRARAGDKLGARCCIPVGSLTRSGPPDRRSFAVAVDQYRRAQASPKCAPTGVPKMVV